MVCRRMRLLIFVGFVLMVFMVSVLTRLVILLKFLLRVIRMVMMVRMRAWLLRWLSILLVTFFLRMVLSCTRLLASGVLIVFLV